MPVSQIVTADDREGLAEFERHNPLGPMARYQAGIRAAAERERAEKVRLARRAKQAGKVAAYGRTWSLRPGEYLQTRGSTLWAVTSGGGRRVVGTRSSSGPGFSPLTLMTAEETVADAAERASAAVAAAPDTEPPRAVPVTTMSVSRSRPPILMSSAEDEGRKDQGPQMSIFKTIGRGVLGGLGTVLGGPAGGAAGVALGGALFGGPQQTPGGPGGPPPLIRGPGTQSAPRNRLFNYDWRPGGGPIGPPQAAEPMVAQTRGVRPIYPTSGPKPPGPGHWQANRSSYFRTDPSTGNVVFIAKGSIWVKRRRRNPANPRALSNSASRVDMFGNLVKRMEKKKVLDRKTTVRKMCFRCEKSRTSCRCK